MDSVLEVTMTSFCIPESLLLLEVISPLSAFELDDETLVEDD